MRALLQITMLVSLALAGCQSKYVSRNICAQLPEGDWWSGERYTQEERTKFCVTVWAYRLAPSPDDADTVAKVVSYTCSTMIAVNGYEQMKKIASQDAGARTQIEADNARKFYEFARYRVVQARAGKCPIPVSPLAES